MSTIIKSIKPRKFPSEAEALVYAQTLREQGYGALISYFPKYVLVKAVS